MSPSSRYTILRKIADGGTAEIFLAKQHGAQGFEKTVVLKRIFTTFYADPQFRHMLVDEAHVAMTLSHSNIVQVLDLGESDGRYFLALELVDGWTLDRVLRRSKAAGVPAPPALALYLTAEVCRALAYAHNKKRSDGRPLGIVHRDISPHNVLLSEQGEVKLTDFGIAKAQTRKEQSGGNLIKGKIAFMSPEQGAGEALDARSDLFSVGTMLYVMITRRHPFDAPTDYETLMLVKSGDFTPPETARPGLNPELYRVIRKAMAKAPGDRYQTAEEMLVDVEQVMRLAFRPVGQTELQRWLADLGSKDGVPPLTREGAPEPVPTTVGPLRAGDGQESGLVLNLDDAVEIRSKDRPPPPPMAATDVMTHPPAFVGQDRKWTDRREVRIGGGILIAVLLVLSVRAMSSGRKSDAGRGTPAVAATPEAPPRPPPAPAPPPTAAPAPPPVAEAPTPPPAAAPTPPPPAAAAPAAEAAPAAPVKVAANEPAAEAPSREKADDDKPAAEERPDPDSKSEPVKSERAAKPKRPQVPVLIKTDPDGTRVTTGKHTFGTTPLTLKLRPGNSYEFTFTKPGYASLSRQFRFDKEEPQTLRVTLKKVPEPHKTAPPPPPPVVRGPPPVPSRKGFFTR
jgi:eukaryotic-like serine/threonine-protein kinase